MARRKTIRAPLALALILSACGNDDGGTPAPAPSMTPTPAGFDVTPCLAQEIPGTGGTTLASAVVPDTLTIDVGAAAGFPNGRKLPDPVVDVTLAAIFLDLRQESPLAFFNLPLNPPANDRAFSETFPFVAAPQGDPPIAPSDGSGFTFRSDDPAAYDRVDRMGMPALATALIGSSLKSPYNDAAPADDVDGDYAAEILDVLTELTNALGDDIQAAGLELCAEDKREL